MSRDARRHRVAIVLLVVAVALAATVLPTASAAPPPAPPVLDTVTATGSAGAFEDIDIHAQSEPSGANASGAASLSLAGLALSGPVTCLRVTGPDQGAGRPDAPTTAVLNFQSPIALFGVQLIDRGIAGDEIRLVGGHTVPPDCSRPLTGGGEATLTDGSIVVFDAPLLPASAEQCKNGGWQAFGVFRNQGDCVSFVATGGRNAAARSPDPLGILPGAGGPAPSP